MAFTAKDVQTLRERTGVGMMDCKKALAATDGDMDKAIDILREKGLAAAAKKAGRIAAEGLVYACVDEGKKVGVVVEVNSETDFAAKSDKFQEFIAKIARVIIDENPADVEDLLTKSCDGVTVADSLREHVLVIGENLSIRRFARYEGDCIAYIHGGGRIGVLVRYETAAANDALKECGKDVAMQIAALNPAYLDKSVVPAADIEHEKEVLLAQIKNDPKMASKPDQIIAKMVDGRIGKFYENNCLMQQAFVKNGDVTVEQYVADTAKASGTDMKIVAFARFEKGEGLQKREDDFAAEVAGMVK